MDWSHLREADFTRLGIDTARVDDHSRQLRDAGPALAEKVRQVFGATRERTPSDPDAALYDGFLAEGDKRLLAEVRTTPPEALGTRAFGFRDARLPELLLRYRARNWPGSLSASEQARWDEYRRRRLRSDAGLSEYTFERFDAELAAMRANCVAAGDSRALGLLDHLEAWRRDLDAGLT